MATCHACKPLIRAIIRTRGIFSYWSYIFKKFLTFFYIESRTRGIFSPWSYIYKKFLTFFYIESIYIWKMTLKNMHSAIVFLIPAHQNYYTFQLLHSLNPSKGVSHTEKVQVKICANKWLLFEILNYFSQCCSDVYSSQIVLSIKMKKISKTTKNGQIIKIIMFEIFRRFKRVTFLNCKDLLLNKQKMSCFSYRFQ